MNERDNRRNSPWGRTNDERGEQRPRFERREGDYKGRGEGRPTYGNRRPSGDRPGKPYREYNHDDEGAPRQRRFYNKEYNNDRGFRRNAGDEDRPFSYRRSHSNDGYRHDNGTRDFNRDDRERRPFRPRTSDYDPNAKYSKKKQVAYREANIDPNAPIRLNKYLANAGICSRREADDYIQAGVVTVNGEVVTELGTKVMRSDHVMFHNQPVKLERKVYILLNKPKDCVTTSDDPQERKTVLECIKGACPERVYPVGRLDRNTTGVLLLTNDGEIASKLTHPKFLKKKIYAVTLDKNLAKGDMLKIMEGITLDDGEIKADDIAYIDENDKTKVGIEIHSGKNRIVRRIFESLGYKVKKLDRTMFAGLTKKGVKRGDWRFLTEKEVTMLQMGAF